MAINTTMVNSKWLQLFTMLGFAFRHVAIAAAPSWRWDKCNDGTPIYNLYLRLSDVDGDSFTTTVTFDEIFRVVLFIVAVHYAGELGALAKMPSLVGQMFAGTILGPQVLAFVPYAESLVLLGEIGLILLMFEAGIEVDLALIKTTGKAAISMSIICAFLATGCGIGVGLALGVNFEAAFSIGATFAQTAIGTCLPVLQSGRLMSAPIGQMLLAATTVDDIIALTLLAVMESSGSEEKLPVFNYFIPIISSIFWLVSLGFVAFFVAPRVIDDHILSRLKKSHQNFVLYLLMTGVTLCYMPLFNVTKSSYLMGASVAGMTFSQCKMGTEAFERCQLLYIWLMKLFFAASIGFQIPIQLFGQPKVWAIGMIYVATAVPIKAVAFLFVPSFQEKTATINLHRRDQWVAALSMMSRGGFGFLISASAFNAQLISADMYASVVLAILLATIFPSYIMNFIIVRYKALKLKAQQEQEESLESPLLDDGKMPLYAEISIETQGKWHLIRNILTEIQSLGLSVEDFKSINSQKRRGVNPTLRYKIYVRDDKTRVTLRHQVPSIEEMGDEGYLVEDRFREIQMELEDRLDGRTVIDITLWSPFDNIVAEAMSLLTRANGDEPSQELFEMLFLLMDKDGDNVLTIDELEAGFNLSGFNPDPIELQLVMEGLADSDGRITYDKWQAFIATNQHKKRTTIRVSTMPRRRVSTIFQAPVEETV